MSKDRFMRCACEAQPFSPGPVAMVKRPASIRDVVAEVAQRRGLQPHEIIGTSRKASIAAARHEVMALTLSAGRWSTVQIGHALRRDHSTVIYGARRHAERSGAAQ